LRTIQQQTALTVRRNTGLAVAEARDPGFSCQGIVGEFIGLYLRCELFATRLQNYYQVDMQCQETGLNTASLIKAFKHFGLHIQDQKVLGLFKGGSGKIGEKSARQLRNGYLHELTESDRNEIISNGPILITEMRKLLKMRINT
jgi:hypothetical protein